MRTRKPGDSCPTRGAAILLLALAALGYAQAGKKEAEPYAVVAGSVFRDTGFALGGAEVTLAATGNQGGARKFKKIKVNTDSRGEFAFRVPAQPMEYTVSVRAEGYQAQEKAVSVAGEDAVSVFFRLEAASK